MIRNRRANGEGTIYPRKDGRYEASAYVVTSSGMRKRKSVYGKTREEVHAKLTVLKARSQQGIPAPDREWRLAEYLDYWLENVVRPNRRPSTYAQCEMIARLYLKPELGTLHLNRLSVQMLQNYVNRKIDEGHSIPKMQVVRKVLSSVLTNAMREELLVRNVARLIVFQTYEPEEIEPWTVEESKRFLEVAQADPLYPAFLLLLLYGLRRGEVLGLRWCDIDFTRDLIHVRHQLQRSGTSLQLGPVKTKAGRRPLPLLRVVRDELLEYQQRHYARQRKAHAMAGIKQDQIKVRRSGGVRSRI